MNRSIMSPVVAATLKAAFEECEKLKTAIRLHRDAKGHDRCWENDRALYAALNEPIPDPEIPCWPEFMQRCVAYRAGYDSMPREANKESNALQKRT